MRWERHVARIGEKKKMPTIFWWRNLGEKKKMKSEF